MEETWIIYCHTNKINNWKYIGQTKTSLNKRWRNGEGYKPKGYINPKGFYQAILDYGWDNFTHEILEENLSISEVDEREKYWINYYHTWVDDPLCKGYNLKQGGQGSLLDKKSRDKISNALKGHSVSQELKQKLSNSTKKLWEDLEYRKNIIKSIQERNKDSEYIKKISNAHKGKFPSEKTKQKMSLAQKNLSQEIKDKRIEAQKKKICKKVQCIETNIIYNSVTEATKAVGLKSTSGLYPALKNKNRTAKGYHWRYVNE